MRKHTLLVFAFCLAILPVIASAESGDMIGWYFDTSATTRCTTGSAYTPVTAYMCLRTESTVGVAGWQGKASITGNCYVTYDIGSGAINILQAPRFHVAYQDPAGRLPSNGVVILATATVFPLDTQPIGLYVAPEDSIGGPLGLSYIRADDPAKSYGMNPASGSVSVAQGWLNGNVWPAVSNNRSLDYQVQATVAPGTITVSNAAGGDVLANVGIGNAGLDSVLSDFGVEEVVKVTLAAPDSITYTVRVTNEQRSLAVYRNTYRFVLPDTSLRSTFVSALGGLACVYNAQRCRASQGHYFMTSILPRPNDPYVGHHIYYPQHPGLTIEGVEAWHGIPTIEQVWVGMVDSGIGVHDDLRDRTFNRVPNPSNPHATQVSGFISATRDNDYAVAGVADPMLFSYGMPDNFDLWDEVDGLTFMVRDDQQQDDIPIINCSWGNPSGAGAPMVPVTLRRMCAQIYNANRILIAAAGSIEVDSTVCFPAAFPSVLAVGGITDTGSADPSTPWLLRAYDPANNHLHGIDLVAPDDQLRTTTTEADNSTEDQTRIVSGTSAACAQVAAAAATLLGYDSSLFNDDVIAILKASATWDSLQVVSNASERYGAGLLKVTRALALLAHNRFETHQGTGYDVLDSPVDCGTWPLWNIYGVPDGNYHMWKQYIRKTMAVPFTATNPYDALVWARNVRTTTCANMGPGEYYYFDGKRDARLFYYPDEGTVTMEGYIYSLTDSTSYTRYYPAAPSAATWEFAMLAQDGVTSVYGPDTPTVPLRLECGPNPFNPKISYSVAGLLGQSYEVAVFNLRGQKVKVLEQGVCKDDGIKGSWYGVDNRGQRCASGVYVLRVKSKERVVEKSISLVK